MPMSLLEERKTIDIFKEYLEYDKDFAEDLYVRFPVLIINLMKRFRENPTTSIEYLYLDNCCDELWDFLDDNGFFIIRGLNIIEITLKYPVTLFNPEPEPEPEPKVEEIWTTTTWTTYTPTNYDLDTEPYKTVKISYDYPSTIALDTVGTYKNTSITTTYNNKPP